MSHAVDVTVETLDEKTTPEIVAVLTDLLGDPIPGNTLDSLTLTYYQEYTQAIINGRDAQNALQANGVTVDANGKLVWKMSVLDTAILNGALETEPHIAHFVFAYPDGADTVVGSETIRIPVRNTRA